MDNAQVIKLMQNRTATIAIGPSTARRMGPKGTIAKGRRYLNELNLASFRIKTQPEFEAKIDVVTKNFVRAMPNGAKHWGACRKFLNIFLRDVLYNHYLRDYFQLSHIEPWLELPLDSHVAKWLHERDNEKLLPKWETVIHLNQDNSNKFQSFASAIASREGIFRIHLDLICWRGEHMIKK